MGFLNNATITIDAILTKKGREILSRSQNEFKIKKFALSDDEVDYTLWDSSHPNGTNYYGTVIENMPILESFPDENQMMRSKLVTLPKATTKMPILSLPVSSLTFVASSGRQLFKPNTVNASDDRLGYTFILHDSTAANITVEDTVSNQGATIPVFLDSNELTNSITLVGRAINITRKETSTIHVTQLTIVGNETGATYTIPITIRPSTSTSSAS